MFLLSTYICQTVLKSMLHQKWGKLYCWHYQGKLQSLCGVEAFVKNPDTVLRARKQRDSAPHLLGNSQFPGEEWAYLQPLRHPYTVMLPIHQVPVKNKCSWSTADWQYRGQTLGACPFPNTESRALTSKLGSLRPRSLYGGTKLFRIWLFGSSWDHGGIAGPY